MGIRIGVRLTSISAQYMGNWYPKACLKRPLKIDKTKVLMENGSLMKVDSIAECSSLQHF